MNNYQRIIWRVLSKATTRGLKTDDIIKDTIGDLQRSMRSIFGDLRLDALVSAEETGTFTFTKRKSRNFLYENLSAGEKAAFDLLLDVVVNKAAFDDSLYCVDEPEAHLSTKLQGKLSTAAGICTGAAAQKCTTGSVVACPRSPWEGAARGATRPPRGWRRPARGRAYGPTRASGVILTVAGGGTDFA